jgi:hypothetical protein
MSHVNVERIIGLLATDEALRRRFSRNPNDTLRELVERGLELNPCERWSLAQMDPGELARFAEAIGPRLQKADLEGGAW